MAVPTIVVEVGLGLDPLDIEPGVTAGLDVVVPTVAPGLSDTGLSLDGIARCLGPGELSNPPNREALCRRHFRVPY